MHVYCSDSYIMYSLHYARVQEAERTVKKQGKTKFLKGYVRKDFVMSFIHVAAIARMATRKILKKLEPSNSIWPKWLAV